jgi:hypothetical protein
MAMNLQMMPLRNQCTPQRVSFLCFVVILFCSYITHAAVSQPLQDLMRSREFRSTRGMKGSIAIPSWVNQSSNYYALYSVSSTKLFAQGVGKNIEGFTLALIDTNRSQQFRSYTATYTNDLTGHATQAVLYMPHPALLDMAQAETLIEQIRLLPSGYVSKDTITLDADTWDYYQYADGRSTLVIKLPMEAMLIVRATPKAKVSDVQLLARKITVAELRRLLSS